MRRGPKPAKSKVAKPRVGGKSSKGEDSRARDLEKRLAEGLEREKATCELLQEKTRALTESLEQQTATGEILRVISSSPTEIQPVFDVIADRAMRLCDADQAIVVTFDGELVHLAALANFDAPGSRRCGACTRGHRITASPVAASSSPAPSCTFRRSLTTRGIHTPSWLTRPVFEAAWVSPCYATER